MVYKKPTSFKALITAICIIALDILITNIFSYYQVAMNYAVIVGIIMLIALAFSAIGIYSGLKYKAEDRKQKRLNTIGIIGSSVIFLFVLLFPVLNR